MSKLANHIALFFSHDSTIDILYKLQGVSKKTAQI